MMTIISKISNKLLTIFYRVLFKVFAEPSDQVGCRNKETREEWLKKTLPAIPSDSRILDAGAGELQYKEFCNHLEYVSQDFRKYDGKGDG